MVPGIGNTEHTHHPKIGEGEFPIPTRLLNEADSNLISDMGDGMASDSIIRNVIYVRTGQNISVQKLQHVTKTVQSLVTIDNSKLSNPKGTLSCTDLMINLCKTNGYDYIVLIHDPSICVSATAHQRGETVERGRL